MHLQYHSIQANKFLFSSEAITILPADPITGAGFKSGNIKNCKETNGDNFIQCVEEKTLTVNDTFIKQMNIYDVQLFYIDDIHRGLGQSVKIKPGVIKNKIALTISLKMNPNMTYEIAIRDPKLQFSSFITEAIPSSLITLKENAGFVVFFLKEIYITQR